mmetsp:Transcript_11573/g.27840  ORF Transcript_11573/g.27840 Transcript_11573/m.27840 type:complete len:230 (+) Transcript_11573:859-1548(+)
MVNSGITSDFPRCTTFFESAFHESLVTMQSIVTTRKNQLVGKDRVDLRRDNATVETSVEGNTDLGIGSRQHAVGNASSSPKAISDNGNFGHIDLISQHLDLFNRSLDTGDKHCRISEKFSNLSDAVGNRFNILLVSSIHVSNHGNITEFGQSSCALLFVFVGTIPIREDDDSWQRSLPSGLRQGQVTSQACHVIHVVDGNGGDTVRLGAHAGIHSNGFEHKVSCCLPRT